MLWKHRQLIAGRASLDPVASAPTTTTLNNSDKGSLITLSGGNLIATGSGASGHYYSVRSVASHATGKFFCEGTLNNNSGNACIGVADSGADINDSPGYFGGSANGTGYFASSQVFQNTGSNVATYGTYTVGDVVGVAVDIGGQLIWFNVNAGVWNAGGSANPSTGVGGLAVNAAVTLFAGVTCNGTPTAWTLNFGATAYTNTLPTGFGNW